MQPGNKVIAAVGDTPTDAGAARQRYQQPLLARFGTLRVLTQRVGTMGTLSDKPGGGTNKTR